ncbi:MAG TPA: 4a-hydroxytetrahydrobiopterin dehydratase [Thioalkalivibrio sp.]|nr:4a-hydroxytetrahydrobiopterin dehydratase [Thioalkalivibrio sp.]
MSDLSAKHCKPCEGGVAPLSRDEAARHLAEISPDWSLSEDGTEIRRSLRFKNYYETMAFVNGVAWVAHREDHHPDLEVGYSRCLIRFSTHAIGGLSENDFICAAKIDGLAA